MTPRQLLIVLLVATVLVTAIRPARAEAIEPTTIMLIASAAVVVVVIVAYLIIANVESYRRGDRVEAPTLLVLVQPAVGETP
jgi:hypothetical protein